MEAIREFNNAVDNPGAYASSLKSREQVKIFGYFCSYTPEEIIHAAGIHPMRLFGNKGPISMADAHLQAYSCSLVRGALEDALSGRLSFLDGAVFPHTCDSIQRLSDIWRLNTSFSYHTDIVLPVKLDTDSARAYMTDVLRKFRRELENYRGKPVTDDELRSSIALYNTMRERLHTLYRMRSAVPGAVSGADVAAVVKASMIMKREDFSERVAGYIAGLEKEKMTVDRTAGKGGKRLLLVGGICDHPEIYALIEASGGYVVWDDLCTGSRYFEGRIPEEGDPIEAIATRYSGRTVCPAKHYSMTGRGENLVRIAGEHGARGVIFIFLKFCDPHSFDYPYMKEFLDRENIPSMLLEIEQELPSEGQTATRLQAFIEMLR